GLEPLGALPKEGVGIVNVLDEIESTGNIEEPVDRQALQGAFEDVRAYVRTGGVDGASRKLHSLHVEAPSGRNFQKISARRTDIEKPSWLHSIADVVEAILEVPDLHRPGSHVVVIDA